MTNILHISVSPHLWDSLSRRIGGELLELLRSEHPDAEIVVRDLAAEPLPHVDGDLATAILTAAAENGVIVLDRPEISVRMLLGPLMSYVVFGGLMSTGAPEHPGVETIEWVVDAYLRTLDFGDGSPV